MTYNLICVNIVLEMEEIDLKYLVIVYDNNSKKTFNSFFRSYEEMQSYLNKTNCKVMNIYKLDELDKGNFR